MKRFKWILFPIILIGILVLYVSLKPSPTYEYQGEKNNLSFDEFYKNKLQTSQQLHVRPGNEEKLIRYSLDKTPIAFLYIHGFGASRAEGEYIVDSLSKIYRANTYYLRLPGHGINMDEHAKARYKDYLDESISTLNMMDQLGEKVIVIGTSMGGLLATYLAANYPKKTNGLILCSPFYDYASPAGGLVAVPGILKLMSAMNDGERVTTDDSTDIKAGIIAPKFEDHWYTHQRFEALQSLEDLKEFAAKEETYSKVSCPLLMIYYFKDKENQDKAAKVESMLYAYKFFGGKRGNNKKLVRIENGSHVLMSEFVKTDKEKILKEINAYISGL